MGLRYWLWKINPWDKSCPDCGYVLLEHGFAPNVRYTCEKCGFGKED